MWSLNIGTHIKPSELFQPENFAAAVLASVGMSVPLSHSIENLEFSTSTFKIQ